MMKTQFLRIGISLAAFAAFVPPAHAQHEVVEVPVARVYVPAHGFDDNDSVEVVVDGILPNSCYTVEKQKVDFNPSLRQFVVRQQAIRQTSGVCAEGLDPSSPAALPVVFTETVTLGRLDQGRYTIAYEERGRRRVVRAFLVEKAPVATADSLPYAKVRSVEVDEVVPAGKRARLVVSGVLNNSCYEIDPRAKVELVNDILVVFPTVTVKTGAPCLEIIRPFSLNVDLGSRAPGRYLVHVRSANGKAHNAVYTVKGAR